MTRAFRRLAPGTPWAPLALAAVLLPLRALGAQGAAAPVGPTREYRAAVVSESGDEVATIVFGPAGARVERTG
ncbi:MAG: hypothetical protein ACKOFO_04315, partial [Gemmatimonadota bacterium]